MTPGLGGGGGLRRLRCDPRRARDHRRLRDRDGTAPTMVTGLGKGGRKTAPPAEDRRPAALPAQRLGLRGSRAGERPRRPRIGGVRRALSRILGMRKSRRFFRAAWNAPESGRSPAAYWKPRIPPLCGSRDVPPLIGNRSPAAPSEPHSVGDRPNLDGGLPEPAKVLFGIPNKKTLCKPPPASCVTALFAPPPPSRRRGGQ